MTIGIITQHAGKLLILIFFAVFLTFPSASVYGQENYQPNDEALTQARYSEARIAQMLAPVALYPDVLLSQILLASTYPIEVVEADRWLSRNAAIEEEELDEVLQDKDWDPSIKAMCHFPSLLSLMSERITETTNLGNAFLTQEADVMAMVQELRAKAYAQGNLTTTRRQKVIVEDETIIIQPANHRVIYIPYYDTTHIYGRWKHRHHRPHHWHRHGSSINVGISFSSGFYFGFNFGSWNPVDWRHRTIYVDAHKRPRFVKHNHWAKKSGRWSRGHKHYHNRSYHLKNTRHKHRKLDGGYRGVRSKIHTVRHKAGSISVGSTTRLKIVKMDRPSHPRSKRIIKEHRTIKRQRSANRQAKTVIKEKIIVTRDRSGRKRLKHEKGKRESAGRHPSVGQHASHKKIKNQVAQDRSLKKSDKRAWKNVASADHKTGRKYGSKKARKHDRER